jgi:hypothetical protein
VPGYLWVRVLVCIGGQQCQVICDFCGVSLVCAHVCLFVCHHVSPCALRVVCVSCACVCTVLVSCVQASKDGSTWVNLATITGRVQEGWSTINLPFTSYTNSYRYFRYANGQMCEVNEIEFLGYQFTNVVNTQCSVYVTVATLPPFVTLVRAVEYQGTKRLLCAGGAVPVYLSLLSGPTPLARASSPPPALHSPALSQT